MSALRFYCNCVSWPREDVFVPGGLSEMIENARDVTRQTFLRHVDRDDRQNIEAQLGYAPHCRDSILTMRRDYHVSYHRSTLHGRRVYFFKHSAIEYVFKGNE